MSEAITNISRECVDHLAFTDETCPDCGEPVDGYGNTESQFKYCSFPDCGCDGARLCDAGEASELACRANVEGMYRGKTIEQRRAVFALLDHLSQEREE